MCSSCGDCNYYAVDQNATDQCFNEKCKMNGVGGVNRNTVVNNNVNNFGNFNEKTSNSNPYVQSTVQTNAYPSFFE